METNPLIYGLSPRVQLIELEDNKIGIRKVIKSRIIRKDAEKIAEFARQIKTINPALSIVLVCTRNICSKSRALLNDEGIGITYEDVF